MSKIPIPEYISLNRWAAEIVSNYEEDFLPILTKEENWAEWGAIVISSGEFKDAGIPSPVSLSKDGRKANFEDWKEWAKIVYNKMQPQLQLEKNKII